MALSLNLDQILAEGAWLDRAATGLITLAQPIFYALLSLWPARTAAGPAWTTAALAVVAAVVVSRIVLHRPAVGPGGIRNHQASRLITTLTEPAATLVGSVLAAIGNRAGVFAQAAGALAGLAIGLATAWILLVEIRRSRLA